jgi:hypothetical protein
MDDAVVRDDDSGITTPSQMSGVESSSFAAFDFALECVAFDLYASPDA